MKRFTIAGVTILCWMTVTVPCTFAQAASQDTTEKAPAKKTPKVWTDDNIGSVRSPEDVYVMQHEQAEEQEESAKASGAKQTGTQSSAQQGTYPVPVAKTPQEADQIIGRDQKELKAQQDYIKQTQKELATAPASYQERLKWRIEARSAIVARLQTQMTDLEKQKEALQANASAANGASSNPAPVRN